MYYAIIEGMSNLQSAAYQWEIIDGRKRYRWYKLALNSVHLIESCDADHDIEDQDFSDMKEFYDCVEWVAKNDPEALVYIMGTLTKPVPHIVKEKLVFHLSQLDYYNSVAIVKNHLASHPGDKKRYFNRRKEKAIKNIELNIVKRYKEISDQLYKYKTEEKHKLFDENLTDAFGVVLNPSISRKEMSDSLASMEWLRVNDPEALKQKLSIKMCKEVKDKLLKSLAEEELYELYTFINQCIETYKMDFYFDIPPYNPDFRPLRLNFGEDFED